MKEPWNTQAAMNKQNTNFRPRVNNSRRAQRTYAFQVLYALNFISEPDYLKKTFETYQDGKFFDKAGKDTFAWSIVHGVSSNLDKLDHTIASYSQNWKIGRIARIELTIMRVAVYEMLHCPDIPIKVSINEAIELAKSFGDGNSRNFVNGILDAVARDIKNDKFGINKGF